MRKLLHSLGYRHYYMANEGWGEIVLCYNRVTKNLRKGTWFIDGFMLDLTYIDLTEFFTMPNPELAFSWVVSENGRTN